MVKNVGEPQSQLEVHFGVHIRARMGHFTRLRHNRTN